MDLTSSLLELQKRIIGSLNRYGCYASTHEALGVLSEEMNELRDAIRANDMDSVQREAFDVAAVALKLAVELRHQHQPLIHRSTK